MLAVPLITGQSAPNEDESGYLLEADIPEISAKAEKVVLGPNASGSGPGIGDGHTAASGTTATASFRSVGCSCVALLYINMVLRVPVRILFPTISQNVSPVSILGNYLEILGKKVDMSEDTLEP